MGPVYKARRHGLTLINKKFREKLNDEEEATLARLKADDDAWLDQFDPRPGESLKDLDSRYARLKQRLIARKQREAEL